MWCVLSLWMVPWLAVHSAARAAGGRFPSPFPLAFASTFFTALYAPLVVRQPPVDAVLNVGLHAAAALLSERDVSPLNLAFNGAVMVVYAAIVLSAGSDPASVYRDHLPGLERRHPGLLNPAKRACVCRPAAGGRGLL